MTEQMGEKRQISHGEKLQTTYVETSHLSMESRIPHLLSMGYSQELPSEEDNMEK